MRFIILIVASIQACLAWSQPATSQYLVLDAVRLGDLVFYYPEGDVFVNQNHLTRWNDLADHEVIRYQSRPDRRIQLAVEWATQNEWQFEFQAMTLHRITEDNFCWSVESFLVPTSSGMTGPPPQFRVLLTGRGDLIDPCIAYWSTYPISESLCIRCLLPESNLLNTDGPTLFGDIIKNKAEAHLKKCLDQLAYVPRGTAPDKWQYHSQELVEGFSEGSRVWKVYFVNLGLDQDVESPNKMLRLCLFASEQGEFGQLSIGGENLARYLPIVGEPFGKPEPPK